MITEQDTASVMNDQSIYEHTLERHAVRLERENRRQQIELGAWRSGRLHTCLVDNGDMAVDAFKIVDCGHTSFFDTVDAAVDALVDEGGEAK